ncbi:MAG: efflux RND transporter periplasmic adaptor subunit [Kordiimonadaceae bacterium]|nr:efflux RND transporter periplasmic adaptor subunit [Kordiimonadaceae bacterium]
MKIIMKALISLFLLESVAFASDEQIRITATQVDKMGIATQNVEKISSVWSTAFPAQVVIPNAQIRVLNPMLPGLVNILYVAEGDHILKGQKLAEISSPEFLNAQQVYLDALFTKLQMSRNHERNIELFKEGIISEKSYLSGEAAFQDAEASVFRAQQSLEFSGLDPADIKALEDSRKMQKNLIVRAPFNGVVLKQNARTGEHISEDMSIYEVGQVDPLWIEIHVPIFMRETIQEGNSITIDGSTVDSRIVTIGKMVHEEDQGIIVRGEIAPGQSDFIPGQLVKARLEQKNDRGELFRIPSGAVVRNADQASIFVRNQDGFLIKKAIIIADEGTSLVIDAEIKPDDQIATKGLVTLKGILEGLGSEE